MSLSIYFLYLHRTKQQSNPAEINSQNVPVFCGKTYTVHPKEKPPSHFINFSSLSPWMSNSLSMLCSPNCTRIWLENDLCNSWYFRLVFHSCALGLLQQVGWTDEVFLVFTALSQFVLIRNLPIASEEWCGNPGWCLMLSLTAVIYLLLIRPELFQSFLSWRCLRVVATTLQQPEYFGLFCSILFCMAQNWKNFFGSTVWCDGALYKY